jgi:hypothetical protein
MDMDDTRFNLGINSDSIGYEVALEALGQSRQPLLQAVARERAELAPSAAFIRYCEARLAAIDSLQDELTPTDRATVLRILGRDPVFATGQID